MMIPAAEHLVAGPTHARTFAEPAVAGTPDGGAWVAWRADDVEGPEGLLLLRGLDPEGRARTHEIVVARGIRGGFATGGAVAFPDGGVAVTWRGDEGLAWIAQYDASGRLHHVSYLEPCEGAPSLALPGDAGGPVVALARPARGGVVVQAVLGPGALRTLFSSNDSGDAPSIALGPRGHAVAYRVGGQLRVRETRAGGADATIAMPSHRAVPHAPALVRANGHWGCAFVGEETGRFSMYVALAGGERVRIADVWAPLERPGASAPALCDDEGELALAWREERGPRPAVYLRRLGLDGHPIEDTAEVRVSARGAVAAPGRVGLAAAPGAAWTGPGWICAFAEQREGGHAVYLRVVA